MLKLKGPPVYVYHEIVHNKHVVDRFIKQGVVFVNSIEEVPAGGTATAALTSAVGTAGGALTALDVVESQTDRMVVDVTCDTSGETHADEITKAIAAIPSCTSAARSKSPPRCP